MPSSPETAASSELSSKTRSDFFHVVRNAKRSFLGVIFWVGGRFSAVLLVAAALSSEAFGQFAVTMSVVVAVERTFNVQSWQLVSRFSVDSSGSSSTASLIAAFRSALTFDIASAFVSVSVVYLIAHYFSATLGLTAVEATTISLFSLIAFANSQGAFTGILRSADQFSKYAAYQMVFGLTIVVAIGASWLVFGLDTATEFIYVWLAVELSCFMILLILASVQMRKVMMINQSGSGAENVCLATTWRFALATLANSSLRMITKEWDVVILSSVGGAALAGMYKLGKQIATLPLLVSDQFYFAVFPKISQLWASDSIESVRALTRKVTAWSLLGASILFGGFFMVIKVSQSFVNIGDYELLFEIIPYCLPSAFIAFATFVFAPALVATGNHVWQVTALSTATVCFLLGFYILEPLSSVAAMPAALFIYFLVWALMAFVRLRKIGGI